MSMIMGVILFIVGSIFIVALMACFVLAKQEDEQREIILGHLKEIEQRGVILGYLKENHHPGDLIKNTNILTAAR